MYMSKYLDTETGNYIKDTDGFGETHGADIAALDSLPASDPSQSHSGPTLVKTVKTGFQSIPSALVRQFYQASVRYVFTDDDGDDVSSNDGVCLFRLQNRCY